MRLYKRMYAGKNLATALKAGYVKAGLSSFAVVDGTLWATGYNNYGELGVGNTVTRKTFSPIMVDVKSYYYSGRSIYIVKNDNTVWVAGTNSSGCLGIGLPDGYQQFTFIEVPNMANMKEIISDGNGGRATYVLKTNGTLWVAGYNSDGRLGVGHTNNVLSFTRVPNLTDIVKVVPGNSHVSVIKADGTLWATGQNYYGQLGIGTSGNGTDRSSFVHVASNIKDVYYDGMATVALKTDNTLIATGYNPMGHLGVSGSLVSFTPIPNVANVVKYVKGKNQNAFIIKSDGTVWGAGNNNYYQLGLGYTGSPSGFTQLSVTDAIDVQGSGGFGTGILKANGELWVAGTDTYGDIGNSGGTAMTFQKILDNVENFSIGTLALMKDKTIKATGDNTYGQLGLGTLGSTKTFQTVMKDVV